MPVVMSTRLQTLLTKRQKIESQLDSGKDYIELEVRGRRVKRERAIEYLSYLKTEIRDEELKRQVARGPSRNKVRLGRP